MRILLLGEYSNVHNTLAQGLRKLGHEVVVASDGDNWKNYPRDIDLRRKSLARFRSLLYYLNILFKFQSFKDYDIVQLINPVFLPLKAKKIKFFYDFLRRHNRKIVLGAFGMDYYYVKGCLDFTTFEYSDFNMGEKERISAENEVFKRDWLNGSKKDANIYIAHDCDAIVAGLYEYYACYAKSGKFDGKLHFSPFPIKPQRPENTIPEHKSGEPLRIFIGIQRQRSVYKGTDIMLRAAERVVRDYPGQCELRKVESVPFEEYTRLMNNSDIILDQLYSYTPAMNALEAMSRGLITVGGAEPDNYAIIGENELRPIVNVKPDEESVYHALVHLTNHRDELLPRLRSESIRYISKHHDYIKVAKNYETIYNHLLKI